MHATPRHPSNRHAVKAALAAALAATAIFGARADQAAQRLASTDPALRAKGYAVHEELAKTSPFKALRWQFVGPKNVSGRTVDVAVVAPKGRHYVVYAATASGGLWKTANEATTWEPVFEHGPSTAIGDIALAPSNPEIVWLGTGEANIFRSSQAGLGVYRSNDAGRTWQHMGLDSTYTIARILVHPKDPDTVYVAASGHEWTDNPERGVFKTTDGGKSWQRVLFVDARTGAIDLAIDPVDPNTLYAATWQRIRYKWNDPRNFDGYTGSGLHKSTDGGRTWRPINKGLPDGRWRGRIGLDVCLTRPNVLYALVDNYEISREPTDEEKNDPYGLPSSGFIKGATVFRSDDKGESWVQTSGLTPEQKTLMERHSGTYGWVFGQIRVDPNDPNTIYTMGVRFHTSNDGGKTMRAVRTPGSDHHALWIDPQNSDYLVLGFDQGFAISYDKGRSWKDSRQTLPVAQFFNIACDMDTPFRVYGSMQDHGSFRGPVDLSAGRDRIPVAEFESAPGGEGTGHAIDPTNPNLVYSSGFYGTLARSDLSKPRGERSKSLLPATFPDEPPLRGEWVAPTILSPHNPAIVYHGMQYVLMSRDRGDTWDRISPDLTYGTGAEKGDISFHTVTTISESPLRFGLLYAGTDDGKVQVTRDGGQAWSEIMTGLPYGKWVSRVVASAHRLDTVYLTLNGKREDDFTPYVYGSSDFGKTWRNLAGNVPVGPVNVIHEDPVNPDILYLGTDMGVYVTTNRGTSWTVLGTGLPSVYAHDLLVHPRDNILVVATHGRGMWAIDVNAVNRKAERRARDF